MTQKASQDKETWKNALKAIYELSATDKEFRALALRDPRAAFEKVVGEAPPNDIEITFVEGGRPRDPVVLVLPEMTDKIEISDEELELATLSFGKPAPETDKLAPAYHNWGSERQAYTNWGSEAGRASYHNWGSE